MKTIKNAYFYCGGKDFFKSQSIHHRELKEM